MAHSCLGIFASVLALLMPGLSLAQGAADCPKSIAAIRDDTLSVVSMPILQKVYQELGCQTKLIDMPGRRGIMQFNHGAVDGELFRLRRAEAEYKRDFVRSSVPLLSISNSLWLHPDPEVRRKYPVGYILGVIWHEQYAKDNSGKPFYSSKLMLEAYRKGRLSGFLATDRSVLALVEADNLAPSPVREKQLLVATLYHYLAKEYAPFMRRFSEKVKRENPFGHLVKDARQ